MSSHDTMNPTGGVAMGHGVESPNPDDNLLEWGLGEKKTGYRIRHF